MNCQINDELTTPISIIPPLPILSLASSPISPKLQARQFFALKNSSRASPILLFLRCNIPQPHIWYTRSLPHVQSRAKGTRHLWNACALIQGERDAGNIGMMFNVRAVAVETDAVNSGGRRCVGVEDGVGRFCSYGFVRCFGGGWEFGWRIRDG